MKGRAGAENPPGQSRNRGAKEVSEKEVIRFAAPAGVGVAFLGGTIARTPRPAQRCGSFSGIRKKETSAAVSAPSFRNTTTARSPSRFPPIR